MSVNSLAYEKGGLLTSRGRGAPPYYGLAKNGVFQMEEERTLETLKCFTKSPDRASDAPGGGAELGGRKNWVHLCWRDEKRLDAVEGRKDSLGLRGIY